MLIDHLISDVERVPDHYLHGRVTSVLGMMAEIGGVQRALSVGDRVTILARGDRRVPAEVVGFRAERALVMPFGTLDGVGLGCRAEIAQTEPVIYPDASWLGRVIGALGEPLDDHGPLLSGRFGYPIRNQPPPAHRRQRVAGKVDLGVRGLNTFLTVCRGKRLGIFAGSGLGKSVLLSMIARYTSADVTVIGLVGERGREVQEFLQDDLGPEGMKRSVVVVATSDQPPLLRRQSALLTLTIAEYFRDQGKNVLCLIDSITRFAMAQREIGLSAGEPPTSKGYTPTVFAELPKLLERAGPGAPGQGSITGLFTVLVEGDDMNEPVADAARAILDGHVVLDRSIFERGRYPAVNVLRSISRSMPGCNSEQENQIVGRARQLIAAYEDMAEMIRLGAYRPGSDARTDEAIQYYPALEAFLAQNKGESSTLETGYARLTEILQGGTAA
jgi:flagellum-specific ATP synthase